MADRNTRDIDWFFITVKLEATYTLTIPAGDKDEALLTAYNHSIPVNSLCDIEKDVVKVVKMTQSRYTVKVEVIQD